MYIYISIYLYVYIYIGWAYRGGMGLIQLHDCLIRVAIDTPRLYIYLPV